MASWLDRSAGEWLTGPAPPAAAAAYSGALGAALVLFACRRTLDGEEGAQRALEPTCRELAALLRKLFAQVDLAVQAVDAVHDASPGDGRASSRAHREAAEIFLETIDACFSVLDAAQREVGSVRPEDVSDLWIGADLAAASLEALAICVRVSLPQIGDEEYAQPAKARLFDCLHEARRARERVLQAVEGRLVL